MPTAICGNCNDILHWRNQRGARLADHKCSCGGAYKPATWTETGWQLRAASRTHKNKPKAPCLCCGRQTPLREEKARRMTMTLSNINRDNRKYARAVWTIQIEAGDPLCSRHISWKEFSSYQLGTDTHDWLYGVDRSRAIDMAFR